MTKLDVHSIANAYAASGPDFGKATEGSDFPLPPAGETYCRMIAYVETGKHPNTFSGSDKDEAQIGWEICGPKYPPIVNKETGEQVPLRMTTFVSISRDERSNMYALFKLLNWNQSAKNFAQMLGQEFRCLIVHKTTKDGQKRARLEPTGFGAPYGLNAETQESVRVRVRPPISELKLFLWNPINPADIGPMWDSIYIPPRGQNATRDTNVFQARIKQAVNFAGSPICEYLLSRGVDLGIPPATKPDVGQHAYNVPRPPAASARPADPYVHGATAPSGPTTTVTTGSQRFPTSQHAALLRPVSSIDDANYEAAAQTREYDHAIDSVDAMLAGR